MSVFVAVHAHASELPYFGAGFAAKLLGEGHTGYLVRTTNDETSGGGSNAQNVLSNETDHSAMARAIGFKDVFELYYSSGRMIGISPVELRGRLVFLLRLLKPDVVLSFRRSSEGEPDADRWVTGRAVEQACLTAGSTNEFHEHFEAGLQPHVVRDRYWFHAHSGQPFDTTIDIGPFLDQKIEAIVACRSQGEGSAGTALRARLAREGRRLPLLGEDDGSADRAYVREFVVTDRVERFQHFGPPGPNSRLEEYIARNAV